MKNIFKRVFSLILLPIFCLSLQGCGNSSKQNGGNSAANEAVSSLAKQGKYSFASGLNLDEGALENLLTANKNGKEYKLIPATDSSEDLNFWTNLVTNDWEYMQTFFLDRNLLSKKTAISEYNEMMESMWVGSKPDTLLFIVTMNGEYCGIIGCDAILRGSDDPTIFYVTSKDYKNQGVATNALKMFTDLLKYLNETEFYDVKSVSVWIFDSNIASITVAKNNGFAYVEKDEKNERSRYSLTLKT